MGKDDFETYLELVPLIDDQSPEEPELSRFYFNGWATLDEAVEVLNQTMANPNNANYFDGPYTGNWGEIRNSHWIIELGLLNEQGGRGGGIYYRIEKSPTVYHITSISGIDYPIEYFKVDRDSFDVVEYTKY